MSRSNQSDSGAESSADSTVQSFRLTLDSDNHIVPIAAGETLLEAALAAGIDAPHTCTEGRCGTCMAWLRNGDVSMASTRALSKRNMERGYVLACQSRPSSSAPIWLDFDL
jgi:ferredoxin